VRFLRSGGKQVVITSYEHLIDAVAGRTGTHILPDPTSGPHSVSEQEVPVGG